MYAKRRKSAKLPVIRKITNGIIMREFIRNTNRNGKHIIAHREGRLHTLDSGIRVCVYAYVYIINYVAAVHTAAAAASLAGSNLKQ